MNQLIDLRTSRQGAMEIRARHIDVTRTAFLHGLIGAGVIDAVRERVKSKIMARGVVPIDIEGALRLQLQALPVDEAVHMLAGVAARCDFVIDLPSYGVTNDATDLVTRAIRELGLTVFVWPEYGPGGPSMNPEFHDVLEEEACTRVATWQPDRVNFPGVMSAHTGPQGMPAGYAAGPPINTFCPPTGNTIDRRHHIGFGGLVEKVANDMRREQREKADAVRREARKMRERREDGAEAHVEQVRQAG